MGAHHQPLPAGLVDDPAYAVSVAEWSAEHLTVPEYIPILLANGNTPLALTASAAVNTELFPTSKVTRRELDLSEATTFRMRCMVTANGNATGAAIRAQYLGTETATWTGGTDLAETTGQGIIVLGTGTTGLLRDTGIVNLRAGARAADRTLAIIVSTAFGSTAPSIGSLVIGFR